MTKFFRHIFKAVMVSSLLLGASTMPAAAKKAAPMSLNQNTPVILSAQAYQQKSRPLKDKRISASRAKSIAIAYVGGGKAQGISTRKNAYKVRVLKKNGKVVDVLVDARSGRVKN